jgi:predicted CoA-binding protein
MDGTIEKMLSLKNWAVAGSTHNAEKFAHKIYKRLKAMEYNVFSLNPGGQDVDGDASYKTLNELPVKPDVIDMVINPVKGREIIADAVNMGIRYIWFQPGAETEELIKIAQDSNINTVFNRCVLVELD